MTWLITAGVVAGWALVTIATVVWFKKMDARYDHSGSDLLPRIFRRVLFQDPPQHVAAPDDREAD